MKQHPLHVHPRQHRKVVRGLVAFLLIVILFGLTAVPFTFSIPILTATKSDLLIVDNNANNAADPGDTIRYTNIFTNSGSTAAVNVNFADTIDANTTLVAGSVKTTPIARHDNYTSIGNVGISVLPGSGVLVNDNDPDGGSVSVIPAAGGTANGGAFAIGSDGAFSYLPPTGFEGVDSFTYLIQDGDGNQDPATVFVLVTEMIWFIDNSAASPGGGGLTTPFNSIAAFNAVQTGSAPGAKDGDIVFLYSGSGNYTSGIVLRNGQTLIGQGATASIGSITGLTVPPFSNALPGTGGSRPIITNSGGSGVALGSGNLLRGLNVGDTSTGSGAGVSGSSVGNLTMLEMSITGQGKALDINGGGTLSLNLDAVTVTSATNGGVSLQSTGGTTSIGALNITTTGGTGFLASSGGTINVTGAANSINSTSGTAVNLTNTTIGSSGITFLSVSASGADTGITLNNTGSGDFTVTGSGTTDGSGGTLQTLNDHGIELINAQDVSISNMNLTNAANTQEVAPNTATCDDEAGGTNTGCNAPVQMVNATNVSLTNLTINGSVQHGINGNNVNGFTLSNSDLSNIGDQDRENGMHFINLLGTVSFNNVTVDGSDTRNVLIENNTGTAVINLTNSAIDNAVREDGFHVIGGGTANITLNVTDSSFTHNHAGQLKAHAEDSSIIDVNITGNDFDGQPATVGNFGIDLAARDSGSLTFDVIGTGANPQTFQPIRSHNINVYASGGGTLSGTIDGNVINESRVGAGIRVVAQVTDVNGFNPAITVAVQNNTISNIQGAGLGGIHIESRDGTSGLSGTANVQATLNNNSVTINGADSVIQALINGGNTMCLDVTNNSAAGAATSPFAGFGSTHYIGNPIPGNLLGGGTVTYDGYISGNLGGTWNANGNTPTLAAGISDEAYVDGTQPTNGTCATVAATANATTVVDAANANATTWAFADKIDAMQAAYQTAPALAKQTGGESAAAVAKDNSPVAAAAVPADKAASTAKPAQSGETINVALGSLDPGQVVVITFDVTVDVTIPANVGQVCNQGVVSGDNFANVLTDDPDVGGVTDPTCTALPRVDIEVTISDSPDPLEAGANGGSNNLVHTITVKNNGPVEATNIVIQFGANTVPAPSLSFSKGSQGPAGNEWSIPSLSVGESATMILTFSIGTDYSLGYVSSSGTLTAVDQTDTNSSNDSAAENTTVTFPNEAPVANNDSYSTNEDTALVEATVGPLGDGVLANDTDADSDPLTAVLDTGTGNGVLALNSDGSFTYTPTADYCGPDSFTYHANDGTVDSNIATVDIDVVCVNDAPVANNDSYSTNEDTALVEATVGPLGDGVLANDTDVDGDALTAVLDTGTSNGVLALNSDGSFTYTPTANYCGADGFTYHANDGTADSNITTVDIDVVCVNDDPTVAADQATVTVDEGQTAGNTGTVGDVDGDTVTLTASVGSVINNGNGTWSWSYNTSDGPADSQTVTITADDGNSGSAQTSFALTVNNVAPTVDNVTAPIDPVEIDSNVTVTVDFSDPAGTADEPYTCTFDYDNDGTVDETVTGVTGTSCDGTNIFTETGVFTVAVTITDKDGDTGTAEYQYVVIFDPFGGYVTGSGRINSPAGAYYPDPTLTGQAVFGFFSEYKRGATIPTGQTEFHFHVAYLDFHSDDYDWLVVTNHKAMFKGTGTLSDTGNYGFIISAIDADLTPSTSVDLFRIQIWDKDNGGAVIYDNQIVCSDMSEDADPCAALAGGDIKILPSRAR